MRFNKIFIILSVALIAFLIPLSSGAQFYTVVALTGNVFDAVTKEPQTVIITINDENGERVNATRSNAGENGYYYLTGLKPGKKYTIILKKQKYFLEKFDIEIAASDKYEEISKDFLIKPLFEGAKIPVPVPPFELNKSKLRFGADDLLIEMANTLKNNEKVKVSIECYPDGAGNAKENQQLTEERCNSLKEYFVSYGIESGRIKLVPSGKTDPNNPPPTKMRAKGKRYIGPTYIVVTDL
jgi:hypothetical protein